MENHIAAGQGRQSGPRCRGLAILETEVTTMTTALKRTNVWSRSDAVSAHPALLSPFLTLRSKLKSGSSRDADQLDPTEDPKHSLTCERPNIITGPTCE